LVCRQVGIGVGVLVIRWEMMIVVPSMYIGAVVLLPVCSKNLRGTVPLIPVEKNLKSNCRHKNEDSSLTLPNTN
jgi:hypothetical protein